MVRIVSNLLAVLLAFVMLSACSVAGAGANELSLNETLIKQSIELTCTMDELAQNANLAAIYARFDDLREILNDIGTYEYFSPRKAVVIRIPDSVVAARVATQYSSNGEDALQLSNNANSALTSRLIDAAPMQAGMEMNTVSSWFSGQYTHKTEVLSALNVRKCFRQHSEFSGVTCVVLLYDSYNSITFYHTAMECVVKASTSVLFLDVEERKVLSDETLADSLESYAADSYYMFGIEYDGSGIEIEYVDGDTIADFS